jgi:hypothetical protein
MPVPDDNPVTTIRTDKGQGIEDHRDEINSYANAVNSALSGDSAPASAAGAWTAASVPGMQKVTVTLVNTPVTMVDEAGVVAYGGLKILDMPEGVIVYVGATVNLALTLSAAGINADFDSDFSLGTVTASNNNTLTGTEVDLLASTAVPQAVAGAATAQAQSSATQFGLITDGTGTAMDVFLNILVDDADHDITTTPTNIICNGTITFVYATLGDY